MEEHFRSDVLAGPSEDWSCLLEGGSGRVGEGGGDAALGCAPCFCARPWEGARAHTPPYGASHVPSFKGIHCAKRDASARVPWLGGKLGGTSSRGCFSGREDARESPPSHCLFIYFCALAQRDAERAQLLHWIICYVIRSHDKGFEMWSPKLVKCALCKF